MGFASMFPKLAKPHKLVVAVMPRMTIVICSQSHGVVVVKEMV